VRYRVRESDVLEPAEFVEVVDNLLLWADTSDTGRKPEPRWRARVEEAVRSDPAIEAKFGFLLEGVGGE
jgi:hypothetical protein